jgi:hypothetical protein
LTIRLQVQIKERATRRTAPQITVRAARNPEEPHFDLQRIRSEFRREGLTDYGKQKPIPLRAFHSGRSAGFLAARCFGRQACDQAPISTLQKKRLGERSEIRKLS